jgi:NAD(P)H dehydrogenase (quinone)
MTAEENVFLVTGATGHTGAPTVKLLCDAGHRVRAFVHIIDQRSKDLESLGAEVLTGDFLDFDAVSSAVVGVAAAYFCYPIYPGGLLQATAIFAQAASEAGVRAVVTMSQISARREATSNSARQHWLAERLLDRTSMMTTHLRPTFFAEWINWGWVRGEYEGVLRLPFGEGRHAPISAADQANVIAAILHNPDPHNRQVYPLVGPEELDHYAIAQKVQETRGLPVRYEPVTIPTFAASMTARGATPFLVQHLSHVAQDFLDGVFAGTNNLVEVISGSAPMTVEDYVAATRDEFNHDGRHPLRDALLPAQNPPHQCYSLQQRRTKWLLTVLSR